MDLDKAMIHFDVPWWLPAKFEGITLDNNIYLRMDKAPTDKQQLQEYDATLVHELTHVRQYREGMTKTEYLAKTLMHGGYEHNPYELEAYAAGSKVYQRALEKAQAEAKAKQRPVAPTAVAPMREDAGISLVPAITAPSAQPEQKQEPKQEEAPPASSAPEEQAKPSGLSFLPMILGKIFSFLQSFLPLGFLKPLVQPLFDMAQSKVETAITEHVAKTQAQPQQDMTPQAPTFKGAKRDTGRAI